MFWISTLTLGLVMDHGGRTQPRIGVVRGAAQHRRGAGIDASGYAAHDPTVSASRNCRSRAPASAMVPPPQAAERAGVVDHPTAGSQISRLSVLRPVDPNDAEIAVLTESVEPTRPRRTIPFGPRRPVPGSAPPTRLPRE